MRGGRRHRFYAWVPLGVRTSYRSGTFSNSLRVRVYRERRSCDRRDGHLFALGQSIPDLVLVSRTSARIPRNYVSALSFLGFRFQDTHVSRERKHRIIQHRRPRHE
jgi:hypothetical protein